MKCMACKQADTQPGKTTVTLERNGATLVFQLDGCEIGKWTLPEPPLC